MDQSYWSISDILADASKVPCHFKLDVPGLSHLRGEVPNDMLHSQASSQASSSSSSSSSFSSSGKPAPAPLAPPPSIPKGAKLELPFWLAELLLLNDLVDISIPRPFSQRVRNALDADAKSVHLRTQAGWWYALGVRLGALMDSAMVMDVLGAAYAARLPAIYSAAQHLSSSASSAGGLDLGGPPSGGGADSAGGKSASGADHGSGSDAAGGRGRGGAAVGMSAEMVEFVAGLEETEKGALRAAHDAAVATRLYHAGRR